MKPVLKNFLVLIALLVPVLLLGLGDRPVYKIQEVRIAETAREMVASGDWVVPRYNGELRLQKPPLPYWLTGVSYLAGGVGEATTRLPAVLFGLFTAALIWSWVRRVSGLRIAANATLILAVSYIGLRYFRSGEADSILLFFITASSMLGFGMLQGASDSWRRLFFGLALGLGFLSKGPAALAIPVLSLLLMAVSERMSGRSRPLIRHFLSVPGVVVMAAVGFGWYAWIGWKMPEIAQSFVGKQVDETFVSGNHAKPLWWYLAHWFEFFAPWGILVIPAGWMAWRRRHAPTPPLVRFAWIWLGVVFVLLTATVNKQMQYALLFLPPLAIVLGHYIEQADGRFARANRLLFVVFCMAVLAGVVAALRKSTDVPHALLWLLIPAIPLMIKRLLNEVNVSAAVLLTAAVTAMLFLYSETYLSKEPHKVAAQSLMAEAVKHEPIYQMKDSADGAFSFYAGRVVAPVDEKGIADLLRSRDEIWAVGEKEPSIAGAETEVAMTVDEVNLFRIKRAP